MGTIVEITVGHPDEALARTAMERAFEEFERVDRLLSGYDSASEVSKTNREAALGEARPDDELFQLLERSLEISRLSEGAFDVTVGPLMDLWKFEEGGVLPEGEDVAAALAAVGFEKVDLDGVKKTVRFLADGVKLDLGGIGKGYAVDLAAAHMRKMGIENAIIDAGGDLRLLGHRPGKSSWRIGVRHPRLPSRLLVGLDLAETAVVTSGDYERYFMKGDSRYHHLLDPRTGYPADACQSVTVIAREAVLADAYATSAFVLGPGEGLEFLRRLPGVEGIVVDAEGNVLWTDEAALKR